MSDLKLFRITNGTATELAGTSAPLERNLQRLIEQNMEVLFGVRLLESEYSTGNKHRGRIDSLGIDENGSPVIFEYKRTIDENVISQGLFYLDWLLDHRNDFYVLVMRRYGQQAADEIDWSNPRLVCVAGDFTRYDKHAVQQINGSIELVRYRYFDGELLALELLTAVTGTPVAEPGTGATTSSVDSPRPHAADKTVSQYLEQSPASLRDLFDALDSRLFSYGDDVHRTTRKLYFAYKRLKNFACVEVHPNNHELLVYVKVDPDSVELVPGFTRDVRKIGHFGTGELEVRIRDMEMLARADEILRRSYDAS